MAKNCFLLLLLLAASASFAQVKLGILGGLQTANITEKNEIPGWSTSTAPYYTAKSGIHAGLTAEIPLGGRFYFQPAVLYTEKGRNFSKILQTNNADSFYSYNNVTSLSTKYFDIPLNLAVKLPLSRKGKTNFLLSAGPYLSLFYKGKKVINQHDELIVDTVVKSTISINATKDLEVGKKDDSYRTFGYGVNARAGFEIGNITLTGFISQGLDNLYYAAYKGTFKHRVYGASLGIWLGEVKEPAPLPKDRDHDGLTDDKDECPTLPGAAISQGCPDQDADGIADKKDKCPAQAGTAKYQGCPVPDTDADGVNDEADRCPAIAGLAKYDGCPIPDTDQDGVNDEADKCPAIAGLAKYNGCPVPDTDKDGVNDEADKCPDVAGAAENNGCPLIKEEMKKQVNLAAENIFFALNSAALLPKSYEALQTVANLLKENPALQLVVNGYTDNTGTAAANMSMSARRAKAVKDYLVANGVDATRITANGFGQSNPLADNATAEGRTKNRRVELKLKQ
ncbi:MAG TPA: OmpA family protein [Chitinophagaceae bacterium]|nr:OmpA family protein [Chitinophagaceae bacterium]